MKKILIAIFLLINILFNYTGNFVNANLESETSSDTLDLIDIYVRNLKSNLKKMAQKYEINEEYELKQTFEDINFVINTIKRARQLDLSQEKKEELNVYLTSYLKNVNESSKNILKQAKQRYEQKIAFERSYYSKYCKELASKVDYLVAYVYDTKLYNKKIFSLKESVLKNNLDRLKALSTKLKEFGTIQFATYDEIEPYYESIKRDIKKEALNLREILKDY